jgi:hypothetical protein
MQDALHAVAVEDVVAQGECDSVPAHEPPPDDERLGEPLGPELLGVPDLDAEAAAVSQEALVSGEVVGRGDQEDLPDAGQHEGR